MILSNSLVKVTLFFLCGAVTVSESSASEEVAKELEESTDCETLNELMNEKGSCEQVLDERDDNKRKTGNPPVPAEHMIGHSHFMVTDPDQIFGF